MRRIDTLFGTCSFFGFLILQLLTAHQSSHKVSREECIVQQDGLCQVVNRACKILYKIKIERTGKTFRSTLLIFHNGRSMGIDQCKMELNLLFGQRRFHISKTQTLREYTRLVQFVNVSMIVHRTLHITHLLIISKCKHRFGLDIHVTILYSTPVIALVLPFLFRIVCYHYLTIVIHIFIRLLTCLAFVFFIFIILSLIIFIILCHIFI